MTEKFDPNNVELEAFETGLSRVKSLHDLADTDRDQIKRMWDTLNSVKVHGSQIIQILSEDSIFHDYFQADAGVFEGYTIIQHTLMVLDLFEDQYGSFLRAFKIRVPKEIRLLPLLKFTLALHDIGKPLAIEKGSKRRQHEFTLPLLAQQLEKFNFSKAESKLSLALVGHDILGKVAKDELSVEEGLTQLERFSQEAEVAFETFCALQTLCYVVDAAAYPSLMKSVFKKENGLLVADRSNYRKLLSRMGLKGF